MNDNDRMGYLSESIPPKDGNNNDTFSGKCNSFNSSYRSDIRKEHNVFNVPYVERESDTFINRESFHCQNGGVSSQNKPHCCSSYQSFKLQRISKQCYFVCKLLPMPSKYSAFNIIHSLPAYFMMILLNILALVHWLSHFISRLYFQITVSRQVPVIGSVTSKSARDRVAQKQSFLRLLSRYLPHNIHIDRTKKCDTVEKFSLKRVENLYRHPHSMGACRRKLKCHSPKSIISRSYCGLLMFILISLLPSINDAYELKPTTSIERVTLSGETAKLPCELPLPADRPTLILWYKDQSTKPFYSYDARETASGRHKIHDSSDLATRSRFTLEQFHQNSIKATRLGFLEVEQVRLEDGGNYTCRVDFMTSQTMMALLKLTVHEEIRGLEVYDAYGTMVSKIVGPYEQSTRVILSCRAYGGIPAPVVQWMAGDMILQSSSDPGQQGSDPNLPGTRGSQPLPMVNVNLHMSGLKREDNGKEIKCVAFNTNLTQPRSRVLIIQVYLPPLEVMVEGLEKPLLAGIESMLLCRSTGSRPPATLTWKLEGSSGLTPLPAQSSLDQNTTLGRGRLLPTPDDNGRTLTCIASNPEVPEYKLEASHTLQIHFAPEIEAKLAPALDPKNIKEGEDVYFECLIKANPAATRVVWLHEGERLYTDLQLGILAQGKNLVLQKVSRHSRGKYQCRVTNPINTITSAATALNVMFVPECNGPRNVTVSVTPTEEVKLNCLVDSNPENVDFIWKVNSTTGIKEFDSSAFKSQGRTSTLVYRPSDHVMANDQYGVVFCQGINRLGSQKIPCMFIISPAGPPEELHSCVLTNQSATSLAVVCQSGHDGGLRQTFIATIIDAESQEVVANISSEEAHFTVDGLAPGRDYLVKVKSTNSKGSSKPYLLEGFALKVHEIKINDPSSEEPTPLVAVFICVLSGFVLSLIIVALANRVRGRRRRQQAAQAASDKKTATADDIIQASPSTNIPLDDVVPIEDDKCNDQIKAQPQSIQMQPVISSEPNTHHMMTSPSTLSLRPYPQLTGGGYQTGSLPRPHVQSIPSTATLPRPHLQSMQQPLHSDDLPHMTSNNHKYYTLKINCTRQNNESFV